VKRLLFALALIALPLSAQAQRTRGVNFSVAGDKYLVVSVPESLDTGVVAQVFQITPGFPFRIVSVKTYAVANARGAVTGQVRMGTDTASVLDSALVFADSTEYTAGLKARATLTGGGSTTSIRVYVSTVGAGAILGGYVVIRIRPTG
jgi:hypothetical protein